MHTLQTIGNLPSRSPQRAGPIQLQLVHWGNSHYGNNSYWIDCFVKEEDPSCNQINLIWCPVLFTLCHQEGVCRGLQGHPGWQPRGYLLTFPLHAGGRQGRGELQGLVPLHLPVWPGCWRGPALVAARNRHRPMAPGFHTGHACDLGALAGLPSGEPLRYSGHLKGHVEHVPQLHPGDRAWPEQL